MSIFLVGREYFDVYTIEAGRGATARAELLGGAGIVAHVFGLADDRWEKGPGKEHEKFGKRVSLGIAEKGDTGEKRKVIYADNVSVVFGNTRRGAQGDPQSHTPSTTLDGPIPALRIGFYSLPGLTEGDIDRASHGRRFPGLGSLFHAYLIQCLAGIAPGAPASTLFKEIFHAAESAIKQGKKCREKCLTLLEGDDINETLLAEKLRALHQKQTLLFEPALLKLESTASRVLYLCDYGDLGDMCVEANKLVQQSDYVLYRASILGPGSSAYEKVIAAQTKSTPKRVIVTKAEHLRGLGVKLNPYGWFQATEDLIAGLKWARQPPSDAAPSDAGPSEAAATEAATKARLRRFLYDADILVVRFGLEAFALIQKIKDPKEEALCRPSRHTIIIAKPEEQRAAPPKRM